MNAARILADAGYDVDALDAELGSVAINSVNVWPASRWVRAMWRPGIMGVTQWRWILVDPQALADRHKLARLVLHELVHVQQFAEMGYVRFMYRYIRDYVSGRRAGMDPREAYLAIPAEVEAREFTSRVT